MARTPAAPQSVGAAIRRITRWMQVLRAHRPLLAPGVPLLFASTLPLLVAALLLGDSSLRWGAAALVLVRTALSVRLSGANVPALWEWLAGEALLLVSFLHSLVLRDVVWRGRRLRVVPGGLIKVIG